MNAVDNGIDHSTKLHDSERRNADTKVFPLAVLEDPP